MTPSVSSPTTTPESLRLETTQLTGDAKVIGPNAPVPDLAPTQPPVLSEKDGRGAHGDRNKELELVPDDGSPGEKEVAGASSEENKDEEEKEEEDDNVYPGGAALAILTFGLCMATFVVALDNTIIGIPSRRGHNRTSFYRTDYASSNRHPSNHHRLRLSQ